MNAAFATLASALAVAHGGQFMNADPLTNGAQNRNRGIWPATSPARNRGTDAVVAKMVGQPNGAPDWESWHQDAPFANINRNLGMINYFGTMGLACPGDVFQGGSSTTFFENGDGPTNNNHKKSCFYSPGWSGSQDQGNMNRYQGATSITPQAGHGMPPHKIAKNRPNSAYGTGYPSQYGPTVGVYGCEDFCSQPGDMHAQPDESVAQERMGYGFAGWSSYNVGSPIPAAVHGANPGSCPKSTRVYPGSIYQWGPTDDDERYIRYHDHGEYPQPWGGSASACEGTQPGWGPCLGHTPHEARCVINSGGGLTGWEPLEDYLADSTPVSVSGELNGAQIWQEFRQKDGKFFHYQRHAQVSGGLGETVGCFCKSTDGDNCPNLAVNFRCRFLVYECRPCGGAGPIEADHTKEVDATNSGGSGGGGDTGVQKNADEKSTDGLCTEVSKRNTRDAVMSAYRYLVKKSGAGRFLGKAIRREMKTRRAASEYYTPSKGSQKAKTGKKRRSLSLNKPALAYFSPVTLHDGSELGPNCQAAMCKTKPTDCRGGGCFSQGIPAGFTTGQTNGVNFDVNGIGYGGPFEPDWNTMDHLLMANHGCAAFGDYQSCLIGQSDGAHGC